MAAQLDTETLGLVFQARPDIFKGIQQAAGVFFRSYCIDSTTASLPKSLVLSFEANQLRGAAVVVLILLPLDCTSPLTPPFSLT
jgi:hypothetical protein